MRRRRRRRRRRKVYSKLGGGGGAKFVQSWRSELRGGLRARPRYPGVGGKTETPPKNGIKVLFITNAGRRVMFAETRER